uniref:Uncharacterized protein n=1 Tax=Plectus sambesii TaxID=2011161 RepID=A0A914VUT2_9BILA
MLPDMGLKELSNGWWMSLSAVGVVLFVSFIIIGIYAFAMRKRDHLIARQSVAQDLVEPKSRHLSSNLESPMMKHFVTRRPSLLHHLAMYDRVVADVMERSQQKPPPVILVHSTNSDNAAAFDAAR